MKITYPEGSAASIVAAIEANLAGRKLGEIVHFDLQGNDLSVKIKKMGTSELFFSGQSNGDGLTWELSREKIAMAHKAFRGEVIDKLDGIVSKTGGTLLRDS